MIEYEINEIVFANSPRENEDESVNQDIVIHIGIVGDPHDFIQKNKITVTIPKTKTMVTGKVYVETKAQEYKDANYPNVA